MESNRGTRVVQLQRWWRRASGFHNDFELSEPRGNEHREILPPPQLRRQTAVCRECAAAPLRFRRRQERGGGVACVCNNQSADWIIGCMTELGCRRYLFREMASDAITPRVRMRVSCFLANRLRSQATE